MVIRKATGSDADDLKTLYFDLPYDNYLLAKVLRASLMRKSLANNITLMNETKLRELLIIQGLSLFNHRFL